MKLAIRVIGFGVAGLAALSAAFFAWLFVASETMVRPRFAVAPEQLAPSGPADLARGRHLADLLGCRGCHGTDLHGVVFDEHAALFTAYPANLTLTLRTWSDEDLARLLRRGVKPNGEGAIIMPGGFRRLNDDDLVSLAAYLRTFPAGGAPASPVKLTWRGRWGLIKGAWEPEVTRLRKERIRVPLYGRAEVAKGRYLASIACAQCHGPALQGYPAGPAPATPDLDAAAAHDLAAFRRLMGVKGPHERFSHFTDEEVAELHAYLVVRAERAP